MCPGVICARRTIWAVVLEAACVVSSVMRWDIMPVSVPRVCLGNPQCKGRVLPDLEELADLQLLRELLEREVKSVGLHKLRRDLQDK